MHRQKFIPVFLILGVTALSYQNCAKIEGSHKFVSSEHSSQLPDSTTSPPPSDNPASKEAYIIENWHDNFPKGVVAADCMRNPQFNLCIIGKDPVTANGGPFSPAWTNLSTTVATEEKIMKIGLRVPTDVKLANDHYYMATTSLSPQAKLTPEQDWKHSYKVEGHQLSKIQVWYWINRQRTYMTERTGKFYYSGLKTAIYAFKSVKDNAYFDGSNGSLNLGYRQTNSGGTIDLGLDVPVLAHEAGHGNLYAANPRATGGMGNCRTKDGCYGGIHEGAGDVHAFILFANESAAMGKYFFNSNSGMRDPASLKLRGVTAQTLFQRRQGEVHDMGEAYASLWYEVWNKYRSLKKEKQIETLFTEHLATLGGDDTFTSAIASVQTLVKTLYPTDAEAIVQDFKTELTRLNITLPK